jgi:F-type H+-transporting ATPase subunit delta
MKSGLMATEISEPYAQAIMTLAQSNNLVDKIGEDMASIATLLKESPELLNCVENPLVGGEAKKAILNQVLGSQVNPFTLKFLMVLVDRGRIAFLENICLQFRALLRQLQKTVLAEVTSAVELSDEQRESIRQRVLAMTSAAQVDFETRIDPDLIGGVIIKVGSQVIDASLRSQLRRITMRLGAG